MRHAAPAAHAGPGIGFAELAFPAHETGCAFPEPST
jgi:hypothetical protein